MIYGLLPDHEIRALAREAKLIEPFVNSLASDGVISYGLSSYGYDLRLADELLYLSSPTGIMVDPKAMDARYFIHQRGPTFTLPPHAFVLGRTVEYVRLPRDVSGLILNKSTYARAGILAHPTLLETGWQGVPTLEITNLNNRPARLYAHEGIVQVLFFRGALAPELSYADRGGIYQHQVGITLSRIRGPHAASRPR